MENVIDIVILVVMSVLVWAFAWTKKKLDRFKGIVMLALYAVYLGVYLHAGSERFCRKNFSCFRCEIGVILGEKKRQGKLHGIFDKLSESLVSAGKDVSQKAKDVSEIAKLKLDIKSKEDYVQKQYEELGRSYYEKHKDEEECEEAEQFFLIREAVEEIERMKAEVLRIQGSAECPKCGAKMPEGAVYCSNCGTKMDDMYEEE